MSILLILFCDILALYKYLASYQTESLFSLVVPFTRKKDSVASAQILEHKICTITMYLLTIQLSCYVLTYIYAIGLIDLSIKGHATGLGFRTDGFPAHFHKGHLNRIQVGSTYMEFFTTGKHTERKQTQRKYVLSSLRGLVTPVKNLGVKIVLQIRPRQSLFKYLSFHLIVSIERCEQ